MANDTKQTETQPRRPVTPELRQQRHDSRAGTTWKNFLKFLCDESGLDEAHATSAAVSVLCALEQRILPQEAEDMNAQLPSRLRELLTRCTKHPGRPRRFGKDQFLMMVAEDLGRDSHEVEPLVRAVVRTLRAQISEGEAEDVARNLPDDLAAYWREPS